MSRTWKVGAAALLGLVLALVGYIGGRSKLGTLLIPNAAAQTAPSNITLAKPSCVAGNPGGSFSWAVSCVADLDGNGKQELIVGYLGSSPVGGGQTEWTVHIMDGSGAERGTGTKLVNTP
jgi:hypothetical protein